MGFSVVSCFFNIILSEISVRNAIRLSNSLDPDQVRARSGTFKPVVTRRCLQSLSIDDENSAKHCFRSNICTSRTCINLIGLLFYM